MENLRKRKILETVEEEDVTGKTYLCDIYAAEFLYIFLNLFIDEDLKTMNDNKIYCNNNFTDWVVLRDKWINSFILRKKITPTPATWLCLKQSLGYNLVCV